MLHGRWCIALFSRRTLGDVFLFVHKLPMRSMLCPFLFYFPTLHAFDFFSLLLTFFFNFHYNFHIFRYFLYVHIVILEALIHSPLRHHHFLQYYFFYFTYIWVLLLLFISFLVPYFVLFPLWLFYLLSSFFLLFFA